MMQEQWKVVADWPEYEVSSEGRIRRNGRLIKLCERHFRPCVNGKAHTRSVRVCVADAFCKREPGAKYIISRDGNIDNLSASNLYWSKVTAYRMENEIRPRAKKGPRRGEQQPLSKLSDDQARAIRNDTQSKGYDLASKYNVSSTTISRIRTGKVWTHI